MWLLATLIPGLKKEFPSLEMSNLEDRVNDPGGLQTDDAFKTLAKLDPEIAKKYVIGISALLTRSDEVQQQGLDFLIICRSIRKISLVN